MNVWARALFAGLVLAAPFARAAEPEGCSVEQLPPSVEYRTFDPAHLPPELNRLLSDEAACCVAVFKVECKIRTFRPYDAKPPYSVRVTHVDIVTALEVTVWTPVGGPRAYFDHEETHREIAEMYYELAAPLADRLGSALVGKSLPLPHGTSKESITSAIKQARDKLVAEFWHGTQERCKYAQDRFDAITDHGRNPIANDEAKAKAIADERAHSARP